MGNSSSKKTVDIKALTSELNFISKRDDPRYGQIFLYENIKTKEIVAYKEFLSKSTVEFKRDVEMLTARCRDEIESQHSNHPEVKHVVKIIGFATQTQDNLCSVFYKIALVAEYSEKDLEGEIIQRSNINEFYTEEQIWVLLESLAFALLSLHSKHIVLGDLRPRDVLISNDGVYKLADPTLLNAHSIPGYNRRLLGMSGTNPYLSPALLKGLAAQEIHPKHDPFKSDVFAAGLTLVHAASLKSCDEIYNWENNTFSAEPLHQRLVSLSNRYSKKLLNLIKKLAFIEEENRPTALQVIEELRQVDWRGNSKAFEKGGSLIVEDEDRLRNSDTMRDPQVKSSDEGVETFGQKKPQRKEVVKSKVREEDTPEEKLSAGKEESKGQSSLGDSQKPVVYLEEQQDTVGHKPPSDANQILSDYQSKNPQYAATGNGGDAGVSDKKAGTYVSPYSNGTNASSYKPLNKDAPTSTVSYSPISSKYLSKYQPLKSQVNSTTQQPQQTSVNPRDIVEPFSQPNDINAGFNYQTSPEVEKILQELRQKGEIPHLLENANRPNAGVSTSNGSKAGPKFAYNSNQFKSTENVASSGYRYEPDPSVKAIVSQYREDPARLGMNDKNLQKSPSGVEYVTETYADGSVYEGQRFNLKRHGRGKFYYSDGGVYDGDWVDGAMHGVGTLFYASGQVAYEGEWNNNKFNGRGSVCNENPAPLRGDFDYTDFDKLGDQWVKYDGEFKEDIKNGVGTLFLSNGDRFDGYFEDDMIVGKGMYTLADGRRVSGEWYHNRLIEG